MNRFILLITFSLYCDIVIADQVAENRVYCKYSPNNKYVIEMNPSEKYGEKGSGKVFSIANGEKDSLLWTIDWYAFEVFIHDDGIHLIRFGPWPSFTNELAISFYSRNNLIKQYKIDQLVLDLSTVSRSVSHFEWNSEETSVKTGFSEDYKLYTIVTTDKIVYQFNSEGGEIINSFKDLKAKTGSEIFKESFERSKNLGNQLLSQSAELSSFKNDFIISKCDAYLGTFAGIYFYESDQWSGDFHPKADSPFSWYCELAFPINEDSTVQVGLKPSDLISAYNDLMLSPFINMLVTSTGFEELRIRASGDRLHWDSEEVKAYQSILIKNKYVETNFTKWIHFIVDYRSNKMISFYHPQNTTIFIMDYIGFIPSNLENLLNSDSIDSAYNKYINENITVFDSGSEIHLIKKGN